MRWYSVGSFGAAATERLARRQATKKVELLNERTWAEAEQLREQAVAAARAEAVREHRQALEALKATHDQERSQLRAEMANREQEANERADERLAATEERSAAVRAELEATHRAGIDAVTVRFPPLHAWPHAHRRTRAPTRARACRR